MLVAMGWMLLAGVPHPPPLSTQIAVTSISRLKAGAAGRVTVWTDREDPYNRGESARVYLTTDDPAHVTVFRVDTDGRLRVLFPREPWGDTYVRDGRDFEVSGARGGRSFIVDDYPGVGYLFAISSSSPFDYTDITRGDYWDYRLIDGGRLQGDPYVLLTDLAARITRRDDFDYDIVPYHVERRYDYPRFVCYDCHAYASYTEWDPYARACSQVRVVIYDDPRYYPYRYNRGRNAVVARPLHPGPRYVFRDADPRSEYVTRLQRRRGDEQIRTSQDVGGQGSIPTPGVSAARGRTLGERIRELTPGRQGIQERRREEQGQARRSTQEGQLRGSEQERRREQEGQKRPEQEGRRRESEGERRLAPANRPSSPPQSTGEPELRRRRQ